MRVRLLLACLSFGLPGCGGNENAAPPSPTVPAKEGAYDEQPVGGSRPARVYVPGSYSGKPVPLVVSLHGYGVNGAIQEVLFRLKPEADRRGFLYVHPNGTKSISNGSAFWNASPACCDFDGQNPDDVGYLTALIDEIKARYAVGPVYVIGHSNGGFMGYRLACEKPAYVAGLAVLAGAVNPDAVCEKGTPLNVVHLHGTLDTVIPIGGGKVYGGMKSDVPVPSADASVKFWATHLGCSAERDMLTPIDLIKNTEGPETTRERHKGCPPGARVELWTIVGSDHVPDFSTTFAPTVLDALMAP